MGAAADAQFLPYGPEYKQATLELFDANCPAYFAPNEREYFTKFLETASPSHFFVVKSASSGEVIGTCGVQDEGSDDGKWSIRWVLVRPQQQGKGLGRAMMGHLTSRARQGGASHVDIGASHVSCDFYAKFGARQVSYIPDGWGPGMHRVDMRIDL